MHEEMKHLEVTGGFYTKEEIEAWERHLEQSGYHNQILHQITQGGYCKCNGFTMVLSVSAA